MLLRFRCIARLHCIFDDQVSRKLKRKTAHGTLSKARYGSLGEGDDKGTSIG